jgi:hypothetical protein
MDEERKKKRPADDFAWQEYEKEEFEKAFPALSRELEGEGCTCTAC